MSLFPGAAFADLTQLQRRYRERWETFIGNAGCIQAFANKDVTTLEYRSKKLGECQIAQTTHNLSTASGTSTSDASAHQQVQSLMAMRGEPGISEDFPPHGFILCEIAIIRSQLAGRSPRLANVIRIICAPKRGVRVIANPSDGTSSKATLRGFHKA